MDVESDFFARRPKAEQSIPATAHASDWMQAGAAAELEPAAVVDVVEDGPEHSARGEDKFGVHKETLFDFRDYGLD